MQAQPSIYKNWFPKWLKLPLLILALFPHLMLMSLFHSNTSFTASILEVEPEDIQFFLSLMYGSVVVTLLVFNRFFAFFRIRSYIILMCSISMLLLFFIAITKDYISLIYLRTFEGIFGVLEGACFLPLIIKELKTVHARVIAYLFLYFTMLCGGTFTASILKFTIQNYGFQEMILVVLFFHLLVILVTVLIFNNNRLVPKYPLFQIDYISCFFLLITLHSGAYALIFGRKFYWFDSANIITATSLFLIFGGLFVLKQLNTRRPSFNFEVLKYKKVLIGIAVFVVFYIIRAGLNNVYNTMSTVWHWPWEYVLQIQYINVAGTFLGIIISGIALMRGFQYKYIFGLGFLLLSIDCFWFTFIFYPDTDLITLFGPLFLQGFAQGWLFTPIVMYMITGMPANLASNASMMGTTTRFWTTNLGFCIMQNLSYYLNRIHFTNLSSSFIAENPMVEQNYQDAVNQNGATYNGEIATTLANAKFNSRFLAQAQLLTNMEIFTALSILAFIAFILIFTIKPGHLLFKKLKNNKFIPFAYQG
jgi:hypothetical protein